jgi:hypothetical protein
LDGFIFMSSPETQIDFLTQEETLFGDELVSIEDGDRNPIDEKFQFSSLAEITSAYARQGENWEISFTSEGESTLQKEEDGRAWMFKDKNGNKSSLTESAKGKEGAQRHEQILNDLYEKGWSVVEYVDEFSSELVQEIYFADAKGRISYQAMKLNTKEQNPDYSQDMDDDGITTPLSSAADRQTINLDPALSSQKTGIHKESGAQTAWKEFWNSLLKPASESEEQLKAPTGAAVQNFFSISEPSQHNPKDNETGNTELAALNFLDSWVPQSGPQLVFETGSKIQVQEISHNLPQTKTPDSGIKLLKREINTGSVAALLQRESDYSPQAEAAGQETYESGVMLETIPEAADKREKDYEADLKTGSVTHKVKDMVLTEETGLTINIANNKEGAEVTGLSKEPESSATTISETPDKQMYWTPKVLVSPNTNLEKPAIKIKTIQNTPIIDNRHIAVKAAEPSSIIEKPKEGSLKETPGLAMPETDRQTGTEVSGSAERPQRVLEKITLEPVVVEQPALAVIRTPVREIKPATVKKEVAVKKEVGQDSTVQIPSLKQEPASPDNKTTIRQTEPAQKAVHLGEPVKTAVSIKPAKRTRTSPPLNPQPLKAEQLNKEETAEEQDERVILTPPEQIRAAYNNRQEKPLQPIRLQRENISRIRTAGPYESKAPEAQFTTRQSHSTRQSPKPNPSEYIKLVSNRSVKVQQVNQSQKDDLDLIIEDQPVGIKLAV